jgi:hypothetical protein
MRQRVVGVSRPGLLLGGPRYQRVRLGRTPAALNVDIDAEGHTVGLF